MNIPFLLGDGKLECWKSSMATLVVIGSDGINVGRKLEKFAVPLNYT
jgi:hypothetical protein